MDVPNLLILSQTVPETCYAGSLLLWRLLRDYPPERLLVIGPAPQPHSQTLHCRYESLDAPLRRWERTRFTRMVHSLRLFGALPRLTLRQVRSRLRGFVPQVVLSVMQVGAYYGLAARFARAHDLPLVLIVHDLPEEFEPVLPWAAKAQIESNAAVYRQAARRLCISPQMRNRLSTTYGADGDVLYPNRSDDLKPREPAESAEAKTLGSLTLGYAGSLAYGYGRQLERMRSAMERSGVRLRIYSAARLPSGDSAGVEHIGFAPTANETWERIKAECDAVVLPYTWDQDHRELYETHFPSKLPEYLALGMPVVVFGPAYATGVRWALEHPDSTLTCTENSEDAWEGTLRALLQDDDQREELAAGALAASKTAFDPAQIREKFISTMCEVSSRTGYQTRSSAIDLAEGDP